MPFENNRQNEISLEEAMTRMYNSRPFRTRGVNNDNLVIVDNLSDYHDRAMLAIVNKLNRQEKQVPEFTEENYIFNGITIDITLQQPKRVRISLTLGMPRGGQHRFYLDFPKYSPKFITELETSLLHLAGEDELMGLNFIGKTVGVQGNSGLKFLFNPKNGVSIPFHEVDNA